MPAIAVATTAPAFAASATCPPGCPNGSYGGGYQLNGWTATSTGTYSTGSNQRVTYATSYAPWSGGNTSCTTARGGTTGGTLTNVILAEADPTSGTPAPTITYQKDFCMMAGITYTFAYSWNYYGANLRTAYLDASLVDPNGAQVASATRVTATGQTATSTNLSANATGTRTFSFTPTVDTWYVFRYVWSFASTPIYSGTCNLTANDIAVTAPTVTCSSVPTGG